MNKQEQQLHSAVVETSEREKQIIAHELHEGLAQSMTALSVLAKVVAHRLESVPALPTEVYQQLQRVIEEAMDETRLLIHTLRRPEQVPEGLAMALTELAAATCKKVRCQLQCRPDFIVHDPQIASGLFRIIQEAVRGAIYHGKASQITISIRRDEHGIQVEVQDNGAGGGASAEFKIRGIDIVQSYAALLGGTLHVEPVSGGTKLTCSVPSSPGDEEKSVVQGQTGTR